jgi:hypothetical protein
MGRKVGLSSTNARLTAVELMVPMWDNLRAALSASKAARATAARRSPGQTASLLRSDPA